MWKTWIAMEFTITCMYNLFLSIMYSVLVVCERAQYKTSCIQYKHVAVINLTISYSSSHFLSPQEDLQEKAGPLGHIYYLLDPINDPIHSVPTPQKTKPPLPNNLPPTSPHRANSLICSEHPRVDS